MSGNDSGSPRLSRHLIAWAAVTALAAGCAGPSISSDSDPSVPVPMGATYAFLGGTQTSEGPEAQGGDKNEFIHQRIQNSIRGQLKAKGFQQTDDSASARFFVRYYLNLKTSTSYVTTSTGGMYGPYYGWGWGYGYGGGISTTRPVQFKEGGLLIDLVERATGKLAWRGTIEGDVPDHPPSQEDVDRAVGEVMASLKPTPAK
jgi:hypothetical protein